MHVTTINGGFWDPEACNPESNAKPQFSRLVSNYFAVAGSLLGCIVIKTACIALLSDTMTQSCHCQELQGGHMMSKVGCTEIFLLFCERELVCQAAGRDIFPGRKDLVTCMHWVDYQWSTFPGSDPMSAKEALHSDKVIR